MQQEWILKDQQKIDRLIQSDGPTDLVNIDEKEGNMGNLSNISFYYNCRSNNMKYNLHVPVKSYIVGTETQYFDLKLRAKLSVTNRSVYEQDRGGATKLGI